MTRAARVWQFVLALLVGLLPAASGLANPTVVPAGPLVVYQQATQTFTANGCTIINNNGWSWAGSGAGVLTPLGQQNVNPASASFTAGNAPGSAQVLAYCNFVVVQTINITVPAVTVTVAPVGTLPQRASTTLSATVTHNNPAVTWSAPAAAGTIAGNVFTAGTTAGTYTITARSVADPTKTGTTTVTVLPPVAVSITPTSATLAENGQQQFLASVTNHPNQAVTWSTTVGQISSTGRYTASFTGGGFPEVKATSVADPSKSATVTVTVVGVTVTPGIAQVVPGGARQFVAQVIGSQQAVTWSTTAPGATISATGLLTTSAGTPLGTYAVSAQTVGTPSAQRSATLTVTNTLPVTGVQVSPPTATVRGGGTLQLAATVLGQNNEVHPDPRVTWTSNAPAPGVGANTGLFTAPDVAGTYTVTANSLADPTRSGSASVSVRREVALAPSWTTLAPLASQTFSARAYGVSNAAITWSLQEGAAGGSVSTSGVYTAPGNPGTYHLIATAVANAQVQAVATIVVSASAPVSLSVSPDTTTMAPAATLAFAASVHGTPNTAVTWSASAGTIDASGVFTAPSGYGPVTVTAVSLADPNVRAHASVTVTDGVVDRALSYDANGNLLDDGQFTYEWDAENRLVRALKIGTRSGPDVRYHYDGLGRRFLIEERRSQQLTRRRYVWIDNQIVEERDSPLGAYALPTNFPATPTSDAEMTADYAEHAAEMERRLAGAQKVRDEQAVGAETLTESETVVTRFFAAGLQVDGLARFDLEDHLGSSRLVLDGAGSVVDRHVYDAFGNLSTTLGDAPKRGFTSHLYQASTGLHLTRTRAYSADLGRWLSRDPIEEAAGLNLYAYVDNDPANVVDPLGLAPAPFPPPPANVPGGPWKWAPNPQNGRGGTYIGRDGSSASWEPQGKNGGHWDVDRGGGHRDRYSNRGKPLTKGEAHSPTKKARQPIDPNTNNQLRKAKKRARAAAAAVARFLRGCKIIPIITINPCVINPCLCPMEPDDPRRFWCGGVTIEG